MEVRNLRIWIHHEDIDFAQILPYTRQPEQE